MTKYIPDSPESIEEIFNLEGDALEKAGFRFPSLESVPDETARRFSEGQPELPSPIDEAERLGVDVEEYLQG